MQITPGINLYWLTPKQAQLSLDPDFCPQLADFSVPELKLVDALQYPLSQVEFFHLAQKLKVNTTRAQQILQILSCTNPSALLSSLSTPASISQVVDWRLYGKSPYPPSSQVSLIASPAFINSLFPLFIDNEIAVTQYPLTTSWSDFPLSPQTPSHLSENQTTTPNNTDLLQVICVPRFLTPPQIMALNCSTQPYLPVWYEEQNIYIGPLVTINSQICINCIYLAKLTRNPYFAHLISQGAHYPDIPLSTDMLQLSSAYIVREVRNFFQHQPTLIDRILCIPPTPQEIQLIRPTSHPQCACQSQN